MSNDDPLSFLNGLTLREYVYCIRSNPSQLQYSGVPAPSVIDAGNVEIFEAAMGHETNFTMLLPIGPGNFYRRHFALPLDQVLTTGSRQVEVLSRVLQTLAQGQLVLEGLPTIQQVSYYGEDALKPDRLRAQLYQHFVVPKLRELPLGKRYGQDWLQQDAQGYSLLHWLDCCLKALSTLKQRHPPSASLQPSVDAQVRKLERQIEAGLATTAAGPAPDPKRDARQLLDTL